jgi:quinol monooxygenase YgiN
MIQVIGSVRIPAEAFERALPMIRKVVTATRTEDGCELYAYSRDLLDPEVLRITEKWRDRAALDAHFKTPHMAVWAAERAELGLFDRNIRVFETDAGEVL